MPDQHVCPEHSRDAYLARHLRNLVDGDDRHRAQPCSFCGSVGAVLLAELADVLEAGVRRYYLTAADAGVPWDKQDGWMASTADTRDVLWDLGPELDDDVAEATLLLLFGNGDCTDWVPQGDPEPTLQERFWRGWADFRSYVQHSSRFLLAPERGPDPADVEQPFGRQEALQAIARLIVDGGLVRTLPTDTRLFRARPFEGSPPRRPDEMAAPPQPLAAQGRMNPAGIAVFYGALDADTAATEVYDGRPGVAIGEMRPLRELTVIDLTKIASVSAFDPDVTYTTFMGTAFLRQFRDDIARQIARDDRIHYEYVPTQFLTEYFRWRLPSGPVDGIVYPSSRTEGHNIVVFTGQDGCLSDAQLQAGMRRAEPQVLAIAGPEIEVRRYDPPPTTSRGTRPLDGARPPVRVPAPQPPPS